MATIKLQHNFTNEIRNILDQENDVIISMRDGKITTNKIILSIAGEFWRDLISSVEDGSDRVTIIIPDYTVSTFNTIMEIILNGETNIYTTDDKFIPVTHLKKEDKDYYKWGESRDFWWRVCGQSRDEWDNNISKIKWTFQTFDKFTGLSKTECKYCTKNFKSKQSRQRHERHCGQLVKLWICEVCAKTFKTEIGLLSHKSTHDDAAPQNFECGSCSKQYKSLGELRRHCGLLKHNYPVVEGPVLEHEARCEVCYDVIPAHCLQNHMTKRHSTQNKFKCDQCSYETKLNNNYHRHMRLKHNSNNVNLDAIKKHLDFFVNPNRNRNWGYECNKCRRLFVSSEAAAEHLSQLNCDAGGKVCKICNKKFTMHQNLKTHMRRKHPEAFQINK